MRGGGISSDNYSDTGGVAGTVALILSAAPDFMGDPFAIRSILLGTVEDYGEAGRDQRFGFGRLDALSSAETAVSVL